MKTMKTQTTSQHCALRSTLYFGMNEMYASFCASGILLQIYAVEVQRQRHLRDYRSITECSQQLGSLWGINMQEEIEPRPSIFHQGIWEPTVSWNVMSKLSNSHKIWGSHFLEKQTKTEIFPLESFLIEVWLIINNCKRLQISFLSMSCLIIAARIFISCLQCLCLQGLGRCKNI